MVHSQLFGLFSTLAHQVPAFPAPCPSHGECTMEGQARRLKNFPHPLPGEGAAARGPYRV